MEKIDYAAKQWNGLIKDYYYPRWKLFFDQLYLVLTDPSSYSYNQTLFEELAILEVGNGFCHDNHVYPDIPFGDPILLTDKFYKKWRTFGPKVKQQLNADIVIEIVL